MGAKDDAMRFGSDVPALVLTSDIDWASDACIDDFANAILPLGIRPVFMATGESAALRRLFAGGAIELGVHPNFLPGSDHGSDVLAVIDHITSIFPEATTFRSHSFVDSSQIAAQMHARGFAYDSNLCLYLQEGLFPLRHASGLIRFPVFWEDDVHWRRAGSWDFDSLMDRFMTPGLKVLNVHPINFALNVRSEAQYQGICSRAKLLTTNQLNQSRFYGDGTRTFVLRLIERLQAAGLSFHTLGELYRSEVPETGSEENDEAGRSIAVAQHEFQAYWQGNAADRQRRLRQIYDQRDPLDQYATSRDFYLRELEILAIRRNLPGGDILDLGCGNGYTLISLSKERGVARMVGVDFSENLIAGAMALMNCEDGAAGFVEFVCADAIDYAEKQAAQSFDAVITERFLLNLPDQATQRSMIRQIYRILRSTGRFLMCEASMEGFKELNEIRQSVGLAQITERSVDNPSAIRFPDHEIEEFIVKDVGFRLVSKVGFSDYFKISRVLHPLLAAPREPRFDAPINALAHRLQSVTPLQAGIGSNTLWIFEKP